MQFSDTVNNTGGVQQVRNFMRVDSNQWPTSRIVNSFNNHLKTTTGYLLLKDKRFQWDNTNHTDLPEGTTPVTASSDYSFLTDEEGNRILTLTRIEYIPTTGDATRLTELDETEEERAFSSVIVSGVPTGYYKIADNIIRLNRIPTGGSLKFYFQRTPPYYTASDTVKTTGMADVLDRGFVIAAALDGAITLGLPNYNMLANEMQKEMNTLEMYASGRNQDIKKKMTPNIENSR